MSTRKGGVSAEPYGLNLSFNVGDAKENVEKNRSRFLKAVGVLPEQIAIPQQRHTATVRTITRPGTYEVCDALVTDTPGIALTVTVADCAPVFLFDTRKKAVACVHAGWRGTEQRIVEKTIEVLVKQFGSNPRDILAWIGPCAGVCCYEVGEDVAKKFDARYLNRRDGKIYLNVGKSNEDQLRGAGVPERNTEAIGDCTICGKDLYHSYRRDRDKSGRMMGVVGINP